MHSETMHLLLLIAAALQFLLILILLRNRRKYKRTRALLHENRSLLEAKVAERTQRLRQLNDELYNEVAKHKTTTELLRESREYVTCILNSMPAILIGVTPDGVVTHWNKNASRIVGIKEADALGRRIDAIFPEFPMTLRHIREAIDSKQAKVFEALQSGSKTKKMSFLDVSFYPLISDKLEGAVISIDDVTLKVQLENMLIQNEKMMSLGELAAGTAHEINNPLGAVIQAMQNIRRRLSDKLEANQEQAQALGTDLATINAYLDQRQITSFLADIEEASGRASNIVTNMLEFSHSSYSKQLLDFDQLIKHSLHLLNANTEQINQLSFADVEFNCDIQHPLPPVLGSKIELQQVLINILRNAFQACANWAERGENIKLSIEVKAKSGFLELSINDNGPGMSKSQQRRIFDPFYTTKEVGQGTGLGLSVSYFIITKHHQGQLEVNSSAGNGATFIIRLPLEAV